MDVNWLKELIESGSDQVPVVESAATGGGVDGGPVREVVVPDAISDAPSLEPSIEDILAGRAGNGRYQDLRQELLEQHQEERAALRHSKKIERIAAYEDQLIEAVKTGGQLRRKLVELGESLVAKKVELGQPLSAQELDTVKLAEKALGPVEDRTMGKLGTSGGSSSGQSSTGMNIVAAFAGVVVSSDN